MKTVTLIELDDGELGFEIPEEIVDEFNINEFTKVFMDIRDDGSLIIKFEH